MYHGQTRMMSMEKAKKILSDGTINGKPITEKQRGLFGVIAGGGKPTRMKGKKESAKHERSESPKAEKKEKAKGDDD